MESGKEVSQNDSRMRQKLSESFFKRTGQK